MKKIENFLYDEAKGKISEYVAMMERRYEDINQEYIGYMNDMFDDPKYNWFNPEFAIKFLRLWRLIMKDADPKDRNLVLAYLAYDGDYEKILECFNGAGCSFKSAASLKVLIWAARKNIRELFEKKYGKTKGEIL